MTRFLLGGRCGFRRRLLSRADRFPRGKGAHRQGPCGPSYDGNDPTGMPLSIAGCMLSTSSAKYLGCTRNPMTHRVVRLAEEFRGKSRDKKLRSGARFRRAATAARPGQLRCLAGQYTVAATDIGHPPAALHAQHDQRLAGADVPIILPVVDRGGRGIRDRSRGRSCELTRTFTHRTSDTSGRPRLPELGCGRI